MSSARVCGPCRARRVLSCLAGLFLVVASSNAQASRASNPGAPAAWNGGLPAASKTSGVWSRSFSCPGTDGRVSSLLAVNGDLYVAGSFTRAGTVAARNVALLRGETWMNLGGGTDRAATCLTLFDGDLVAGG